MMDDINKYAKIWDDAMQKGIFDDASKVQPEKTQSTDFFGQYLNDDYDMDKPLNEVDSKYWRRVSQKADPLFVETKDLKNHADTIAKAQNSVYPSAIVKDQDINVQQNWAMGGKEIEQLEKLKLELHDLESKLNNLMAQEENSKPETVQSKIDSLKKEIDSLSDSLAGSRFKS